MAKHLEYKAQSEKKLAAGTQIDKRVNLLIVGELGPILGPI